jgi:hypothetical protein
VKIPVCMELDKLKVVVEKTETILGDKIMKKIRKRKIRLIISIGYVTTYS